MFYFLEKKVVLLRKHRIYSTVKVCLFFIKLAINNNFRQLYYDFKNHIFSFELDT